MLVGVIKCACEDFRVTELEQGGTPVELETLSEKSTSDVIEKAKAIVAGANADHSTKAGEPSTEADRRAQLAKLLGDAEIEKLSVLTCIFEDWLKSEAARDSFDEGAMQVSVRDIANMDTREQRLPLHMLLKEFFPLLKRKTDSSDNKFHICLSPDLVFASLKSVCFLCPRSSLSLSLSLPPPQQKQ
jgi:hypothetical protein